MNEPESTPQPPATADIRAALASGIAGKLSQELARSETLAAFRSVAKREGVRPEEMERAFQLSGIVPSHEIKSDEGVLRSAVVALRSKNASLFDDADIIPETSSKWRDAAWMAANQDKLVAHARAKLRRTE
jgi:hypothetical protein